MSASETSDSLPYHEPDIITILVLSSFLVLLNIVNHVFDRITYIGLIGQILVGIAWGSPGAKLLSQNVETVIVDVGYLGLLLLVFEGGLSTSFRSLKANFRLSILVAFTGISLPIGLSYVLVTLVGATSLQAFAAGAALCSTSLGTTFTVLQTTRLNSTRMGVVLSSAAMMDDVVGLIMVQVISNLGTDAALFSAVTVVRPVLVSLAFALAIPVACRWVIWPLTVWLNGKRAMTPGNRLVRVLRKPEMVFLVHTAILIGMVTAASYAGTSNLFAAYLTGAAVSWWDAEVPHSITAAEESRSQAKRSRREPHVMTPPGAQNETANLSERLDSTQAITNSHTEPANQDDSGTTGLEIFEKYYQPVLQRILRPFFFASIGFSIPIAQMFTGQIIWRGLVYAILMTVGKLFCGAWLLRIPVGSWSKVLPFIKSSGTDQRAPMSASNDTTIPPSKENRGRETAPQADLPRANSSAKLQNQPSNHSAARSQHQSSNPNNPISLYPATIVGWAMVSRGEIGFLISSLADTNGIFGEVRSGRLFLTVTWAIMLCTIVGPLVVGLMVKRLRGVSQTEDKNDGSARDVLGVWGLN